MNRNTRPNIPARLLRRDGRREALQRLDETLERNRGSSNAEIIALLRKAMFADVDALEKSGKVILPK